MSQAVGCLHSGNCGDLIHSLPTARALCEDEVTLYLGINSPGYYGHWFHPLGNVMMNEDYANKLIPLLERQSYIKKVKIYEGEQVDHDLNEFRRSGINLGAGHISRWYFQTHGVTWDLSQPWLTVDPDTSYKDYIVVTRTHRYRNESLHYGFMQEYKVLFVGVEEEYKLFRMHVPCEFKQASDFLELARIIAGSKFFIGNQTFNYALAEAMKTPRILEIYNAAPNVIPCGGVCYDIWRQHHFENIVRKLST